MPKAVDNYRKPKKNKISRRRKNKKKLFSSIGFNKQNKMNDTLKIEQQCIIFFGSKRKANKFIKQAISHGKQIRIRSKSRNVMRYDYNGYQLILHANETKINKKLGMKALMNIVFKGDTIAKRMSSTANKSLDINSNHMSLKSNSSSKTNQIEIRAQHPSQYPKDFQYTSEDNILILGEMDFSLAVDIAHKIGGRNITATAYYAYNNTIIDQQTLDNETKTNISDLKRMQTRVLFNVDATQVQLQLDLHSFDKILFAFPRNSECPNSERHNIAFMKNVFKQVSNYMKNEGQFHLLLHINRSGHSPFEAWKLKENAKEWKCVFEQIFSMEEIRNMFVLYQFCDGNGKKWMPHKIGLYIFQLLG